MNVGILTFHSSYNFGANLQALAIQRAVETAGAHPTIINYQDSVKMGVYRNMTDPAQATEHERFVRTFLKTSALMDDPEQLESFCRDHLDVILVGSDQVFRLVPAVDVRKGLRRLLRRHQNPLSEKPTKIPPPYWLNWNGAGSGSRLTFASIAASAGATSYRLLHPGLPQALGKCLDRFDMVTVRDRWTEKMVVHLTQGRVRPGYCPDPVFGLKPVASDSEPDTLDRDVSKTLLVSADLDPEWMYRFVEEAHGWGYTVASLPNPEKEFPMTAADVNIRLPLPPVGWFRLLAQAAGYIGIRFHALVSCIANKTPVVSIETTPRFSLGYRRKSRLFDLCRRAGMESRFLASTRDLHQISPRHLLERLFDPISQERADRFADLAPHLFQDTIERALTLRRR